MKAAARNREKNMAGVSRVVDALAEIEDLDNLTSGQIAEALNRQGVTTGSGKTWTGSAYRRKKTAVNDELKRRAKAEHDAFEEALSRDPAYGSW